MKRLNNHTLVLCVCFVAGVSCMFSHLHGAEAQNMPAVENTTAVQAQQTPAQVVVGELGAMEKIQLQEERIKSGDFKYPQQTESQKEVDNQRPMDMEQLQRVMLAMMVDYQKKKEEARRHLLDLLPEEDRTLIIKTREEYEVFLDEVNLVTGLTHACTTVSTFLQEAIKKDAQRAEALQKIIFRLDVLHQGLVDGSFLGILNNGQSVPTQSILAHMNLVQGVQSDDGKIVKTGALTAKDFAELVELLGRAGVVAQELQNSHFVRAWNLLHRILTSVVANDIRGLTLDYMNYLRPNIEETQKKLQDATTTLDKKLAMIPVDGDRELRRAYVLLTRELSGYLRTLMVFASLERDAASMVSKTHTLFTLIAYSYDCYKTVYSFYRRDYPEHRVRDWLLDAGLRSAIATWHFFMQKSDSCNSLLFNTIQGSSPVSSLSPMQLLMYNAMLAPFAMLVFWEPSFFNRRMHGSIRELGKIAASWVYYHVFHCVLFQAERGNESSFLEEYDGIDSVWPRDYKYLRSTIYHALTEAQRYVFKNLSRYIRVNFYPRAIEKVENATMGIIRPELIGYMAETLLPLVMLDRHNFVNNVIHCQPGDVFAGDFNSQVRGLCAASCFTKPRTNFDPQNPSAEWTLYNQNMLWCNVAPLNTVFLRYAQHEHYDIDIKAYYVECQLMSYVFSSFGLHWGRILAKKYQGKLGKFLAHAVEKTVNACAGVGLMSKETAEMFKAAKNEFNEGLEEAIDWFKGLFKQVFIPGSPIRAMVISILERRGDIEIGDNVDSLVVTKEALNFLLLLLAENSFISYLDVEVIEESFEKNPTDIDALVDSLVKVVRNNFVSMIGGRVGSSVSSFVGDQVMWYCGPFYPKVRDWLHSA